MKPLSNNELSMFCGQMSMILHSGISSTEGLSLMAEDSPEQGKRIIRITDFQYGSNRYFSSVNSRYQSVSGIYVQYDTNRRRERTTR